MIIKFQIRNLRKKNEQKSRGIERWNWYGFKRYSAYSTYIGIAYFEIPQINQCKINSNFRWMRSLNKWYRINMATDILLRVTMHVLHYSTLWQSRIIPSIYEARFDRKIPNESSIYGRIGCSFYATYWSVIDDFSILLNYYWRLKIHVYSKRDVTVNI